MTGWHSCGSDILNSQASIPRIARTCAMVDTPECEFLGSFLYCKNAHVSGPDVLRGKRYWQWMSHMGWSASRNDWHHSVTATSQEQAMFSFIASSFPQTTMPNIFVNVRQDPCQPYQTGLYLAHSSSSALSPPGCSNCWTKRK